MFKVDEEGDLSYLSSEIIVAEKNYVIKPNDRIEVRVYTNKGDQIIDPNNELDIQQNQNNRQQDNREGNRRQQRPQIVDAQNVGQRIP